jgi:pteridine reductase
MSSVNSQVKTILITGAAKRIGAACVRFLHQSGHRLIVHYHQSQQEAEALCAELNQLRENSAYSIAANLEKIEEIQKLAQKSIEVWHGVDVLINNASVFYPQTTQEVTAASWQQIMACHLTAPFFLAQGLRDSLAERQGCIINLLDIHAERGLKNCPVYSLAKAGLAAMTRILAKELAPQIRVNGIAPGAILWPETPLTDLQKNLILERVALERIGDVDDIAQAMLFLIHNSPYITGQILTIDGGRTLFC